MPTEVIECLEVMKGQGPIDLIELSLDLAGRMLVLGGRGDARGRARDVPGRAGVGRGAREVQGDRRAAGRGPARHRRLLAAPEAPEQHLVHANSAGFVSFWMRGWWAAPQWRWAAAATGLKTRSIQASAL
jgi:thymidine phosphorylase